ncbi:restriction endonuclease subunit S [Enterobacter sp. CPE_E1214]|uniref:restriction endonuclease subunit S n=1 Tax=unclassified Enterobacter TaxID=2608935 RepID=UPI00388F203F
MAKYKAYPEYKDSGVEWLGDIPTHWDCTALKRLCSLITGLTPPTQNEDNYADEGYPWVRPEDLNESGFGTHASKYVSDIGWKLLRHIKPNSTLICCIGTIGKCGYVKETVSTNQQLTAATFRDCERFNYYLLQAARAQLEELATGNVLKILNSERLGALNVVKVNRKEANTIAEFLDHETTKIDDLIEKQQQLIELLKEKCQAVIIHAVTKGLNPDVTMKDSGVEWLGELPEHWELVPLKYLCSFSGGGTPTKDNLSYWQGGTVPWVSPKDMKYFWISETQDYVTPKAVSESSTNYVEEGSLLMVVRSGILQRNIPVAINIVKVTMNQDMKALRFNERMKALYAAYFINGNVNSLLLEWTKEGATVESIEHEYLANGLIPVPPIDEQHSIIKSISDQMIRFELLEEKALTGIRLLQERRTALISAAVTGKIDVRDWVAPETQDIEETQEATA